MWQTKARLAITFASDSLASTVPSALIIVGFAAAGLVLAWICIWLGDVCSRRASIRNKSRWRVFFLLLALSALMIAFSIGFNAAGFNFWTIILSYGVFSLFVGTMFGDALKCMGAYALISLTRKIEEGYLLEINGSDGTVRHIHFMWISMRSTKDGMDIDVPTWWVFSYAMKKRKIKDANLHP